MTLLFFLSVYILGGLTFLPLILVAISLHALVTFPENRASEGAERWENTETPSGEKFHDTGLGQLKEGAAGKRPHEPDVAAGYFAVSREFAFGAFSGRPLERNVPANTAVTSESPSVYTSMYRSVFERGKLQYPSIETEKNGTKPVRRAHNVFYIVLRHGHLMLYDDEAELEVRHVIFLAHYSVDLCADKTPILEGDLFVKRNCIRLNRRKADEYPTSDSRPFFLFSDSASEKEDFYHALIQSQGDEGRTVAPLAFNSEHLVKLIQQIHQSEENLQTRWLNALLGRLFLALYKTQDVENYVRSKISKKISRVRKPMFISSIRVRGLDLGDIAPLVTNLKLRELGLDGDMTLEADVRYNGGFRLEIEATARIEFGTRFKAREVSLILVGILNKLEGHVLVRIKPPPSNRIWISFESMPQMNLSIEPIVSSRQIKYGIILRAIESRIREVVKDTLVMPNWDDFPFCNSSGQRYRGGLWTGNDAPPTETTNQATPEAFEMPENKGSNAEYQDQLDSLPVSQLDSRKSMTVPELTGMANPKDLSRTPVGSSVSLEEPFSVGIDSLSSSGYGTEKPKTIQSDSVAGDAVPVISKDAAANSSANSVYQRLQDVGDSIEDLFEPPPLGRSQPSTSHSSSDPSFEGLKRRSIAPLSLNNGNDVNPRSISSTSPDHSQFDQTRFQNSIHLRSSSSQSQSAIRADQGQAAEDHAGTASPTARKWSWNVMSRQGSQKPNSNDLNSTESPSYSTQPVGRGRPLPPPGVPLPGPQKTSWAASSLGITKRKPVSSSRASSLSSPVGNSSQSNCEQVYGQTSRRPVEPGDSRFGSADYPISSSMAQSFSDSESAVDHSEVGFSHKSSDK